MMACDIDSLRNVPLFALLDNDELAVLAGQVEFRRFQPRQRIWKIGDEGGRGYVILSGMVQVKTIDEDQQEVLLDQPGEGEIFGFASMLDGTPHQTEAVTMDACECIEVDRNDISVLLERKPHAGLDMMSVLGRQFHNTQKLVKLRAARNPNDLIEERETVGERFADVVAAFGGSWTFIILFAFVLALYATINVELRHRAWDPYPFILLNLFLSMLASVQAPVIMMSQNRQDKKDRLRSELDYEVNRRAHSEIQGLANKLNFLGEKVGDIEELLREGKR
jgi:CRP/FNR family transcriptional regulator, cyclic AMP receptor protein